MSTRDYWNSRRKNRRQKFIDLLGGQCERCGATDNLHFDHMDPKKKKFRIADRLDAPIVELENEVNKCRLLCPLCHRAKTKEFDEHGQPKARHGTLWMYKKYRCRCDKCKKAMSEYGKERRKALKEIADKI